MQESQPFPGMGALTQQCAVGALSAVVGASFGGGFFFARREHGWKEKTYSLVVSSGPVFFGFLAIFGNFEAREKSFEFSHVSCQKKNKKKTVFYN